MKHFWAIGILILLAIIVYAPLALYLLLRRLDSSGHRSRLDR